MIDKLQNDGCLYQDDVVDYIVRSGDESFLRENADGNLVLDRPLLKSFKDVTSDVVWVQSDFYWRYRVVEDEGGRKARG
ncbi:hypothetical protein [uncultured Psychrobacter sp.]|uniref:DUF6953 family protein n=1 Tax=uncultured Psychrobacter sp. TaxID=259303 RepID=UPI003458F0D2